MCWGAKIVKIERFAIRCDTHAIRFGWKRDISSPPDDYQDRPPLSRLVIGVVLIVILMLFLTGTADKAFSTLVDFTLRHGG